MTSRSGCVFTGALRTAFVRPPVCALPQRPRDGHAIANPAERPNRLNDPRFYVRIHLALQYPSPLCGVVIRHRTNQAVYLAKYRAASRVCDRYTKRERPPGVFAFRNGIQRFATGKERQVWFLR
ncbi:hypothetical protein DFH07DRAFT_1058380 [Mycena maculata]|uniref:Uncharacterized protein n=1 Tax=Mycena maculata TaxID=230809 RepID=A0AAD7JML2_9AGAR|nr:hypothetical protein DFH07DRAFT_1058380 [Mycena maculata]